MSQLPRIGLVMKSLNADFFQEMKKGALEFANTRNNFELLTVGTNTQTEVEEQIQLVDDLITQQVDAIVLVPIDSKALVPVTIKAVRSGIKVVNIDIRLDVKILQEAGVELTYVGPDNMSAAKAVGDVLAKQLTPGSKVALIEGLSVAENAWQRKAGFLNSISEYNLELVASEAADWETAKAYTVFEKIFISHPDIKGVFCCNDAMALGVLNVLRENGRAGQIRLVGFDNDASIQNSLANGEIIATVEAYGSQMAVKGIEYALKILSGMENKGSYSTDYKLVVGRK